MKTRRNIKKATITVVLPVLNEAAILPRLLSDLRHVMTEVGCRWNVLVVNDGSTDGSPELLDAMSFADKRIRVVHLSRNFGQQAAIQAGLAHASGDAVILMDSDGQDDPRALPEMIRRWSFGDEVVYAVRYGRKEGMIKRTLFKAFYYVLHGVASVEIPRDAGNFSLLDRRVVDLLSAMPESDRYLPGLRSWIGFKQSALRVERFSRHDRYPRVTFLGLCRLARNALFGFSRIPLQAFYALAFLSAAVSVLSISFACFHRFVTGQAIPGWTSITSVAAFFGAINALGIAILGEYVCRIYDQVRQRPSYIIDRTSHIAQETDTVNVAEQTLLAEMNALRLEIERITSKAPQHQTPEASESLRTAASILASADTH